MQSLPTVLCAAQARQELSKLLTLNDLSNLVADPTLGYQISGPSPSSLGKLWSARVGTVINVIHGPKSQNNN